jgi:hypothetical protein
MTRFPELTEAENAVIDEARVRGWAVYYPAFPSGAAQASRTLEGARAFLAGWAVRPLADSAKGDRRP